MDIFIYCITKDFSSLTFSKLCTFICISRYSFELNFLLQILQLNMLFVLWEFWWTVKYSIGISLLHTRHKNRLPDDSVPSLLFTGSSMGRALKKIKKLKFPQRMATKKKNYVLSRFPTEKRILRSLKYYQRWWQHSTTHRGPE